MSWPKSRKKRRKLRKCLKIAMFTSSMAFAALGFVRLAFAGEWLASSISKIVLLKNSTQDSEGVVKTFLDQLFVQPTAGAVLGGLEMTITFFICCAGCCGINVILELVVIVVSVLIFATFVLFAMACAQVLRLDDFASHVTAAMLDNFVSRYANVTDRSHESRLTIEMDVFQVQQGCCGVQGYEDYQNASLWKTGVGRDLVVPETCCKLNERAFFLNYEFNYLFGDCTTAPNSSASFVDTGCAAALMEDTKTQLKMRGILISCVSLVVQMLTLAVFIIKIRFNRQRVGKHIDLDRVTTQVLREVHTEAVKMGINKHRMSAALENLPHDEGAGTTNELPKPDGTLPLISSIFNWSQEDANLKDRRSGAVSNYVSAVSGTSE